MGSFCLENVLIAQGCGTSSSSSESTPIRSSSGAERALVPMVSERVSVSRDTLTLSRVFIDASIQGMSRVSSLRWSFFLFSGILARICREPVSISILGIGFGESVVLSSEVWNDLMSISSSPLNVISLLVLLFKRIDFLLLLLTAHCTKTNTAIRTRARNIRITRISSVVGELSDCSLDSPELGRPLDAFVKALDSVAMGCVGKTGDFAGENAFDLTIGIIGLTFSVVTIVVSLVVVESVVDIVVDFVVICSVDCCVVICFVVSCVCVVDIVVCCGVFCSVACIVVGFVVICSTDGCVVCVVICVVICSVFGIVVCEVICSVVGIVVICSVVGIIVVCVVNFSVVGCVVICSVVGCVVGVVVIFSVVGIVVGIVVGLVVIFSVVGIVVGCVVIIFVVDCVVGIVVVSAVDAVVGAGVPITADSTVGGWPSLRQTYLNWSLQGNHDLTRLP